MIEFFKEYSIVKWVLVGFGVLYFLDKYGIFSPIDNLINRIGKYKFKMYSHLNNPKLKELINYFNKMQFSNVEQSLKGMNSSYRAFAFKSLGQYGKMEISDQWLHKDPSNNLPKIVKAYQLINKAWEIRGRGTIDTVSNQNQVAFKNNLKKAETLLLEVESSSPFDSNCVASLLKIYKATDMNREYVHKLFNDAIKKYPDDEELHFNYFAFISPKWGASEEELQAYLKNLTAQSPFIQYLILAQYYFDIVHLYDYKDDNKEIKRFIEGMKTKIFEEDQLYKYELYLLLYWLSNNLELKGLEKHYKKILTPYWED
ncbi:hypothetical protein [Tenacibaculum xiamenense]|uniref:hypothetical protein n=1 Tax=Tenacibaculum xiamenense TaxID=1261553 RepID=UPI003895465E